jgi:hypothetical protein
MLTHSSLRGFLAAMSLVALCWACPSTGQAQDILKELMGRLQRESQEITDGDCATLRLKAGRSPAI